MNHLKTKGWKILPSTNLGESSQNQRWRSNMSVYAGWSDKYDFVQHTIFFHMLRHALLQRQILVDWSKSLSLSELQHISKWSKTAWDTLTEDKLHPFIQWPVVVQILGPALTAYQTDTEQWPTSNTELTWSGDRNNVSIVLIPFRPLIISVLSWKMKTEHKNSCSK